MDLDSFGKKLQFNKRNHKEQPISEEELFIESVGMLSACWEKSNLLYEKFKISILEYEEEYYQIIENLMFAKYGLWKTEIIMWYVFGRTDADGNIYPLVVKIKGKEEEKVYIETPLELWNFLDKLEEQKKQDEKE